MLVKKSYPERKRRSKRNWKLKSIAKEAEDPSAGEHVVGRGALGRRGGLDSQRVERDYEQFLRDLEEDEEMRANVNMYKDKERIARDEERRRRRETRYRDPQAMEDDEDDKQPPRDSSSAMDSMDDGGATTDNDSEYGSDSELPRVQLDELLDDMDEMAIEED